MLPLVYDHILSLLPILHLPSMMLQEVAANERVLCASVVLDQKPEPLQQHLATAVYEACRAGDLKLAQFPDFATPIQRLKEVKPDTAGHQYQVCVRRGDSLVVLGTYANKWLQSDEFKGHTKQIIEGHNTQYNKNGEFVEEEERTG